MGKWVGVSVSRGDDTVFFFSFFFFSFFLLESQPIEIEESYDPAQCGGGARLVIMSIIGRLKPTTTVNNV